MGRVVTTIAAVSAVAAAVSGGILLYFFVKLHEEARHLAGGQGTSLLVATGLLGAWTVLRCLGNLIPLPQGDLYFVFRNGLFAGGLLLGVRAVLSFSSVTSGHRTAAVILVASATSAIALAPTLVGLMGYVIGMGFLAAIVAVLGFRLGPAGPGVRGLALAGAAVAIADAWLEVLLIPAGLRGDLRLFQVSTLATDVAVALVALFALPALREAAMRPPAAPPPGEATGP